MKKQKKNNGIFLVAISAISFGFTPIFAKMAYSANVGTFTLLFLRFSVAALFMFSLIFIRKLSFPSKKESILFLLLGFFGYAGQSCCYFMALNYASAGVVSLLLYTYPAFVMLGSVLFMKEKVSVLKIISLILSLTGALVIIGG